MIKRPITDYVTWFKYGVTGESSQGNDIEGFRPGVRLGIFGFDPAGSAEAHPPGRDVVITTPRLFMPYGSGIGPHDEIEVFGVRYKVEGEPKPWKHPKHGPMGDEVNLRRADG
ncbi:hypothetical protein G7068_03320 [Leucobacter viscericola]|uniref:Uncharacterized protein n=1 Tax=Leucobacter viscericola TaxID=2714935 RepID=A0A6G7XCQ7_9MICO|nr:hypothetical protein [Leucobacter viscericola]QIK62345.1 hypothetical protein G7068_03320 [Leucobacter viscericola]